LVASTGWVLRTGAFPRGIAYGENGILVGLSQVAHRSGRHETSGIVRRFTPEWRYAADYVLPSVGMVLAILSVDLGLSDMAGLKTFEAHRYVGDYNPLEPGNIYHLGNGGNAVFAPEWHVDERTHRWTAARESRMAVVVNPGEMTLVICASSGFPGPYWAEVLLNDHSLAVLRWSEPGSATSHCSLPPEVQGSCKIVFRVPHLWQPSACLGSHDQRKLGVCVHELRIV
jgi:hypothetical protein